MANLTAEQQVIDASNCDITLAKPTCELRWAWPHGKKTLQQAWRVERHRAGQLTTLEVEWRDIPETGPATV